MLLTVVLAFAFAGGLFLAVSSMDRTVTNDDDLERMLKGYGEIEAISIDEIELRKPFEERVLRPALERFGRFLGERTPQKSRDNLRGRPRLEALEDMGRRCGVEDLNNFIQAIIQSEQMGVGIAKILRIQATELRRKRRQRAQETAAQATLKMMLPMVGCIFPTLWIILLGPAILVVLKAKG